MAAKKRGIAEIILGAKAPDDEGGEGGSYSDDDSPPSSEAVPGGLRAACGEVWDAIKADDEEAFCRALEALHKM